MHQILREWAQAVFRGSYRGNCSQVEWRLRSLYIVARGAGAACLTAALVAKVDDIRETVLGNVSQIGGGYQHLVCRKDSVPLRPAHSNGGYRRPWRRGANGLRGPSFGRLCSNPQTQVGSIRPEREGASFGCEWISAIRST